jgi:hypothetical protein
MFSGSIADANFTDRFEVFAVVKIQVEVFWDVTPHSIVVGYQCFRGLCSQHLMSEDRGIMNLRNVGFTI